MLLNKNILRKSKTIKENFSYSSDQNGKYLSRSEILNIFKSQRNEIA
jgi:hypothetical protein